MPTAARRASCCPFVTTARVRMVAGSRTTGPTPPPPAKAHGERSLGCPTRPASAGAGILFRAIRELASSVKPTRVARRQEGGSSATDTVLFWRVTACAVGSENVTPT
nr:hypothetical protein [Tanacetum cinerariifolium]